MPERLRGQDGFTLIELLVVTLIIGALAAIAFGTFLNQQKQAHDAEAKSNARGLMSMVEGCFTTNEDFQQCDTAAEIAPDHGLPFGTGPGTVSVVEADERSYAIEAVSLADEGGTNRIFRVERSIGNTYDRTCDPHGGGCKSGRW